MNARKILVVEDDADIRESVVLLLQEEGLDVYEAAHGREALERLRQHPDTALVLLDLMMPVMDGWEFRERQVREPQLATIPVVVVSASGREADRLKLIAHLAKPVMVEQLLATIASVLNGHL